VFGPVDVPSFWAPFWLDLAYCGGNYFAIWGEPTQDTEHQHLLLARLDASGNIEAQNELDVTSELNLSFKSPELACLSNGTLVASWATMKSFDGGEVRALTADATGKPFGSWVTIASVQPQLHGEPHLTSCGDSALMAWFNQAGLSGWARYFGGNVPVDGNKQLSAGSSYNTTTPVCNASTPLMAWVASMPDICPNCFENYAQLYSSGLVPQSQMSKVSSIQGNGNTSTSNLAGVYFGGSFLLFWAEKGGNCWLSGAKLSPTGTMQLGPAKISLDGCGDAKTEAAVFEGRVIVATDQGGKVHLTEVDSSLTKKNGFELDTPGERPAIASGSDSVGLLYMGESKMRFLRFK